MSEATITRRHCLQLAAGVTAGAAGLGSSRFTGNARAWFDDATSLGCSNLYGYVAREIDVACGGQQVEPGSSTPEAIAESWYRTGMYAREHDEVTLQTIWNRLEDARTIAYVRAKSAALEAINNSEDEQFVTDVSKEKIDEHYATVQTNLLNHWEVQLNKLLTYAQEAEDHSEIDSPWYFAHVVTETYADNDDYSDAVEIYHQVPASEEVDLTLVDGTERATTHLSVDTKEAGESPSGGINCHVDATFSPATADIETSSSNANIPDSEAEYERIYCSYRIDREQLSGWDEGTKNAYWFQLQADTSLSDFGDESLPDTGEYLTHYLAIWERIIDEHSQMIDNIETWVSEAYGSVQADETTVTELVANDPYVLAQGWATDYQTTGHLAYAAADLATMGLSFDSENRMALQLDDGTELEGTLYTSDDDFEHAVGAEIDPAASSADFYVAADTNSMARELPEGEYRNSIGGGELKLNTGVAGSSQYVVETAHGETVSIPWDEWTIEDVTANDDVEMVQNAESVVVDLSDELDTAVTSVESITVLYYGDEEAVVLEITDPFVILEAYDVETGEAVDTVSGQGYNAGTSTVDLSWTEQYLEMRSDTDDYAEDSGGGGGGVGIGWSNPFGGGAVGSLISTGIILVAGYLGYDIFLSDDS